jgi:hypothetical protein
MKIKVYATDGYGEGHVLQIGEYDNWEDIELRVSMFDDSVVFTFEYDLRHSRK